jgi:acetyltransferase-like isoleucine patch superfamily enzyme
MEVMVLDGVHVEEGVILGAKSLVTRDLPEYCVAVGIPAEIKYYRDHVSDGN